MSRWRRPWLHLRTAWSSERGASHSGLSAKSGDANRFDRSPSCATEGPPLWPDRSAAIGHEQCDHRKAMWLFMPSINALMQTYGKCGSRLCGGNGLDAALMTARRLLTGIGLLGRGQVAARESRKAGAQSVYRASAATDPDAVVPDHHCERLVASEADMRFPESIHSQPQMDRMGKSAIAAHSANR